jgi:hypothetical protein
MFERFFDRFAGATLRLSLALFPIEETPTLPQSPSDRVEQSGRTPPPDDETEGID